MNSEISQLKRLAAEHAVEAIESGMVVGLGHGSTAIFAVRRLASLLADGSLHDVVAIPASLAIETEARKLHIPLTTFADYQRIDVTIDGADEIDPQLNVIKGGGGALLREKVLAQASRREIIVVDYTKQVPLLGTNWALPVEVIPFGWESHYGFFAELGASVSLRVKPDGSRFLTDQGNLILDCNFGPINDLRTINQALNERVGIVEHGLFLGLVSEAIVASPEGLSWLKAAR